MKAMNRNGAFLLCTAAALAMSHSASAEMATRRSACAHYETIAKNLANKFGEFPAFTGQLEDGLIFRVFVNASSGSWTMLVIRTDGRSCIRAVGEGGTRDVGL